MSFMFSPCQPCCCREMPCCSEIPSTLYGTLVVDGVTLFSSYEITQISGSGDDFCDYVWGFEVPLSLSPCPLIADVRFSVQYGGSCPLLLLRIDVYDVSANALLLILFENGTFTYTCDPFSLEFTGLVTDAIPLDPVMGAGPWCGIVASAPNLKTWTFTVTE